MGKPLLNKKDQIHNRLPIDLAGAILPRSSPDYLTLRYQLRAAIFDTLATSTDTYKYTYVKFSMIDLIDRLELSHSSYIFTDFQTTDEVGSSVAEEYAEAAKRRGCAFVPIVLACDAGENEHRMRSAERRTLVADGKGLLLDAGLSMDMRGRGQIYRFECGEGLLLDVTGLASREAAERMMEHLKAVCVI